MPKIRMAGAEDALDVARVFLESHKNLLPYVPLTYSDEAVRAWIRGLILSERRVLVAICDGEIVAMCVTSLDAQGGWIEHLYVLPGHVGRGVGSALLAAALRELRRPVRLYTFEANHGARRFYEKAGFVAVRFGDGSGNEQGLPDVLYELDEGAQQGARAWAEHGRQGLEASFARVRRGAVIRSLRRRRN